ncbi:MAG: CpaF family protein [Rugosibacter sp.]|nr:CpaF family protein [Rugosibacter sp.]
MSLRERLESVKDFTNKSNPAIKSAAAEHYETYHALKSRIHQKLLDRVDLKVMEGLPPDRLKDELKIIVDRILTEEAAVLNESERRTLVRDIQYEMLGLGPLEPLLADLSISDILVNTYAQVYVERHGKLELTDVRFSDDVHLKKIIDKIVSRVGRRIDESSPMVDARLPDGSRVNAIIPPVAIDGPILSIRRFAATPLQMDDLISFKSVTPDMATVLEGLARAKTNILISGGTGTGKTTLLNILSGYIPPSERIVTIEDAAELQMQQPHVVRLETRPMNIEERGEITQRMLVRNALRMRPDRIILGEVRGSETIDMLQAMNTGHEGSMATIHSNSPRDALTRLENMIGMGGMPLPPKVMRQQISSAISVIIQITRLIDGRRKISSIQEITGMEGEIITMQEIFKYTQTGLAPDGSVQGYFSATGVRPRFLDRLHSFGVDISDMIFDPRKHLE